MCMEMTVSVHVSVTQNSLSMQADAVPTNTDLSPGCVAAQTMQGKLAPSNLQRLRQLRQPILTAGHRVQRLVALHGCTK